MTLANYIPEYWATAVQVNLRKAYVFPGLTNSLFEGEVRNSGDTVHIQTPVGLTVNSPATGLTDDITYEDPTSTTQALLINQSADWDFRINDMDALQANVELSQYYTQEGANGMADAIDQNIAALYVDAGATIESDWTTYAADTVQSTLVNVTVALSENNVPSQGRWIVVDPRAAGQIRRAYGIGTSTEFGADVSKNGWVGYIEGMNIYESNNIVKTADPDVSHCMSGYNGAITLAMQKMPTAEALRLQDRHGDGFRSLMIWGRKVVRDSALIEVALTFGT